MERVEPELERLKLPYFSPFKSGTRNRTIRTKKRLLMGRLTIEPCPVPQK
jgi:hypothetical protein